LKNTRSISLEDSVWNLLGVEAEKRGLSKNLVAADIIEGFVTGNPILATTTNVDLLHKQEKLLETKEKVRRLQNENNFFEKHGFYPSRSRPFEVVHKEPEIIYHPKNTQSIAELNKKIDTQQLYQDKAEPEITDLQWEKLFPALTRFDTTKNLYHCEILQCGFGCQRVETMQKHIIDNHEEILQESLRVIRQ